MWDAPVENEEGRRKEDKPVGEKKHRDSASRTFMPARGA
jgi:hypothetical protein